MRTCRVSAASTSSRWGQIDRNIEKVRQAAEKAAQNKARLLLLPECCITGADWPTGETKPSVAAAALTLKSPVMQAVTDIARKTGLVLVPGLYESYRSHIYVSQAVISPKGLIGVYRKVHEGSRSSRDKERFPVFDLGFIRIGISVCYDNMFPECARILALKGAELLLSPFTSLPLTRKTWRLERLLPLRARAQDNRLFVLSASHAHPHVQGKPGEWGYSGICCAVDPLGEIIAESRGRVGHPQSICVSLDEKLQRTYLLADVPSMRARKPGIYKELADAGLQTSYMRRPPGFEYNVKADRLTAKKK